MLFKLVLEIHCINQSSPARFQKILSTSLEDIKGIYLVIFIPGLVQFILSFFFQFFFSGTVILKLFSAFLGGFRITAPTQMHD